VCDAWPVGGRYEQLVHSNPENASYYADLEATASPPLVSEEERCAFYKAYETKYPYAHVPRRAPLFFTSGALFETHLTQSVPCASTQSTRRRKKERKEEKGDS
jgi:hypothetical protein